MKLFSLRSFGSLAMAAASAIAAIAACGDDSNQASPSSSKDATTTSSSSGAGSSGTGSGSSGASGSGSSGSKADASVPNVTDATTVVPGSDALVLYDGEASAVAMNPLGCSTPDGLTIRFNPMYSGYDGVHTYQVPTFVPGVDPSMLTWGSTDPSMVDIQPYAGRPGMMLTTKKAGDVQIVATLNGSTTCGYAPLHIEAYTPDEWQLGSDRYNNGNPLTLTIDGTTFDGAIPDALPDGAPLPDVFDAAAYIPDAANLCATAMMYGNPFENPPAACTNCHGTMSNGTLFGMALFMDVQHTPEQTGGFSESDLTNVFLNGTVPSGGYFDNGIIDYCTWHQFHTWSDIDTAEKQKGMNAYLRSLTPMEQVGCFELFLSTSSMCSDGGLGTGTGD